RASIQELEQQDLEKLMVFLTDSFTTTSLYASSLRDVESRPNPITLKTWIELTDRIKN
ncbi:14002_t:CDS:1, partial [Racocetra persica]